MKNSTAFKLLSSLALPGSVAGCSAGVDEADNSKSLQASGIQASASRAQDVCTDFNGKVIYNQPGAKAGIEFKDQLKGQVAELKTTGGGTSIVKGSCSITVRYYDSSADDRVAEIRKSAPVVATLTNGIDSIQLSEHFTKAEDLGSGADNEGYDGLVKLTLEGPNHSVLEEVYTNAANLVAPAASATSAIEIAPATPAAP